MGIKSVAVYSDSDRNALHVREADEAYYIGESEPSASYLDYKKIIDVALKSGADGIHPGYGFLSENAAFAKAVTEAGIKFIGPSPAAISIMGDKLDAKSAVSKFDIPMVPGTDYAVKDVQSAVEIAKTMTMPILIKASAGGGGKGMRKVTAIADIESEMERAMSEAQSAFGNPAVFIEKFVERPKHIEIQILADDHGNTLYIFERECSVQRRHQKVVEEAPSPAVSPALRKKMGETAMLVAKACNYTGAGTVEFLLDPDGSFYFLEMNTRLQVEHPVTELISGLDLVEQQILIARGQAIPFSQDDLVIHGHSIELRIYAEDPSDGFVPSIGTLETYILPKGEHIRVDDGYEQGMEIPIYYDPMIAKLVVWGRNRTTAIERMKQAISRYHIDGIKTTLDFGRFVMEHPVFVDGTFDTNFVPAYFTDIENHKMNETEKIAALVGAKLYQKLAHAPRI
ncbi:UNVERIFIED_CONTAM: hypothetical protein GTU68_037324 [Idotea baltica]|nr:hypothetical protein [Idotea baltica]